MKISGENFQCLSLDWDTEYFGVKSARIILNGIISEENKYRILEYCKAFEFVTISNVGNIKENNGWLGNNTEAFLTDMNIQFIKRIKCQSNFEEECTEVYNNYLKDEKVIYIAESAFLYSRFFNDPSLPKKQAENIYVHWVESAFGQENKYFVITKRNDEVAGYILFSIDEEEKSSTIELVAVDKTFRGQRVGTTLISGLEKFVYNKGISNIKVGTQVDNITAVRFYTACGFQYVSCSSVYHLWGIE